MVHSLLQRLPQRAIELADLKVGHDYTVRGLPPEMCLLRLQWAPRSQDRLEGETLDKGSSSQHSVKLHGNEKSMACQTSINTHPNRAPEGRPQDRDKIITTLYTASVCTEAAVFADRARA